MRLGRPTPAVPACAQLLRTPEVQHSSPATLELPPLLLALLAAAARTAAAAETIDISECQANLWSGLPLAKQHAPSQDYDPTSSDYYQVCHW